MARKTTKTETTVTTETNNMTTTAIVPKKAPAKKAAAPKEETVKELDWSPLGKVSEWRTDRVRMTQEISARVGHKIDQLRLEWIYYVASAFFAGITFGVMICNWLR